MLDFDACKLARNTQYEVHEFTNRIYGVVYSTHGVTDIDISIEKLAADAHKFFQESRWEVLTL